MLEATDELINTTGDVDLRAEVNMVEPLGGAGESLPDAFP
jgi:hypothetical protein